MGSTTLSKHIVLNFYDEFASASAESAPSILQKHFPAEFKSKFKPGAPTIKTKVVAFSSRREGSKRQKKEFLEWRVKGTKYSQKTAKGE